MASETTIAPTERRLCATEMFVLRDHAREVLLHCAAERLRHFVPRSEETAEEIRAHETDEMMGAAEVFGACKNIELELTRDAKGLPPAEEYTNAHFTDRAMEWMAAQREEYRVSLARRRGTIEMWDSSAQETLLLFVLDGICGGEV